MRIFITLLIVGFATSAQAVLVTEKPRQVPAEDIARSVEVPAYHTTILRKGQITYVDKPAQTICYDKANLIVSCIPAAPKAPLPNQVTINQPRQSSPSTSYSGPNQYEQGQAAIESQYAD